MCAIILVTFLSFSFSFQFFLNSCALIYMPNTAPVTYILFFWTLKVFIICSDKCFLLFTTTNCSWSQLIFLTELKHLLGRRICLINIHVNIAQNMLTFPVRTQREVDLESVLQNTLFLFLASFLFYKLVTGFYDCTVFAKQESVNSNYNHIEYGA